MLHRRLLVAAMALAFVTTPAAAKPMRAALHAYCDRIDCPAGAARGAPAGDAGLAAEARRHLGATAAQLGLRHTLWCGAFIDRVVLPNTGHRRLHSDRARDFAQYGQRISGPRIGAIAVMARGSGGHVGIVTGIDAGGNPVVVSGNHNNRVREAVYPRARVLAYVMPGA
jgi:uncharacterized protein (TIGR02594 family)